MSRVIALAGNPNSGKTTLFNRLTGLNQRVGNYPGVTVERRAGRALLIQQAVTIIDVPGTYSLISRSRDEAVAFEVLTGRVESERPDLAIIVLDASNLDRNLYLALQILELGMPAIIALNMVDLAEARGLLPSAAKLSAALGVPVVPVVASEGRGLDALRSELERALAQPPRQCARAWRLSDAEEAAIAHVAGVISDAEDSRVRSPDGEAIWLLTTLAIASRASTLDTEEDPFGPRSTASTRHIQEALVVARDMLSRTGNDFPARVIEARYQVATRIAEEATDHAPPRGKADATERIDAVLLHPVLGGATFLLVMGLVFQSIFSWAEPLMNAIQDAVAWTGSAVRGALPPGALADLLADGVVGGVGNVLVFVPQIGILFFFITVLEDSGYLARAAFITDRMMTRIGLHGRAFVPLISGFACAVPAIMSTRTIESRKDRLVTILVTPLVSCSARLPVYGLIISALFGGGAKVFGVVSVGALLFLGMYLLSIAAAITAAFVLKRTMFRCPTPPFVLELPPYRMPVLSSVGRRVLERCRVFVRDAGTMILACSIVLWAALYFPHGSAFTFARGGSVAAESAQDGAPAAPAPAKAQEARAVQASPADASADRADAERLRESFAGRVGQVIEPVIRPLGFDWKIGIGLLASFAAREVLVSTLGLVYGVGRGQDEESLPLREAIQRERDPRTGKPVYTPLVGLALMVFFVLACQCMSTLAVVRRETGSWRWPAFMFTYMTVLAWCGAFTVYQGGRLLGFE